MTWETASAVNVLVDFCARRDVPALTRDGVRAALGDHADVAILFGGSVPAGVDVLAEAIRGGVATRSLIVGGQGHTTGSVRSALRARMPWSPELDTASEAALYDRYLWERHGLRADLLEERSTNCGTNVTHALALLRDRGLPHRRLVLIQDATMQQRMDAGFRRHAEPATRLLNFASHRTTVTEAGGRLVYDDPPDGMWAVEHYVSLLLGEVPRLTDDAEGYGPAGRGYIAHVDVPARVRDAYRHLVLTGGFAGRVADPRWAG